MIPTIDEINNLLKKHFPELGKITEFNSIKFEEESVQDKKYPGPFKDTEKALCPWCGEEVEHLVGGLENKWCKHVGCKKKFSIRVKKLYSTYFFHHCPICGELVETEDPEDFKLCENCQSSEG